MESNLAKFVAGLEALSRETGIYLVGQMKHVDLSEKLHELLAENAYTAPDIIDVWVGNHRCRDVSGRFLLSAVVSKPQEPVVFKRVKSCEIIRDIEPYQSLKTGEMITSRSKHREHLKEHNLMEVGNERKAFDERVRQAQAPDRVTHEDVARVYDGHVGAQH